MWNGLGVGGAGYLGDWADTEGFSFTRGTGDSRFWDATGDTSFTREATGDACFTPEATGDSRFMREATGDASFTPGCESCIAEYVGTADRKGPGDSRFGISSCTVGEGGCCFPVGFSVADTSADLRCSRIAACSGKAGMVAGVSRHRAWQLSERKLTEFCFHRMSGSWIRSHGMPRIIGKLPKVVTWSLLVSWCSWIPRWIVVVWVIGPALMGEPSTRCTACGRSFGVSGRWFLSQKLWSTKFPVAPLSIITSVSMMVFWKVT